MLEICVNYVMEWLTRLNLVNWNLVCFPSTGYTLYTPKFDSVLVLRCPCTLSKIILIRGRCNTDLCLKFAMFSICKLHCTIASGYLTLLLQCNFSIAHCSADTTDYMQWCLWHCVQQQFLFATHCIGFALNAVFTYRENIPSTFSANICFVMYYGLLAMPCMPCQIGPYL